MSDLIYSGDYEEFFQEVEDARLEYLENHVDEILDLLPGVGEFESPDIYTEEEICTMAVEKGILTPGDWNDGNYDPLQLAEKIGVHLAEDEIDY